MRHRNILKSENAVLVVVDVQEAFRSPIEGFELLVGNIGAAVRGFQILGLPVVVTEQYPKGLGPTAEEIRLLLTDDAVIEKSAFSACEEPLFLDKLKSVGATQVVLCGLETHICVSQTAHDLLEAGFEVHLLTDCVDSRFSSNKGPGIRKMELAGVIPSSAEAALFELLVDSKHPKFKEIQNLIK